MSGLCWVVGACLLAFAILNGVSSGMAHLEGDMQHKVQAFVVAIVSAILGAILWRIA